MADLFSYANSPEVALAAATAKTVLQVVAPTNHRLKIHRLSVSFRGIVNTETPVLVELVRQSTAGTMSALTLVKGNDSDDETLLASAQHTATVEPTTGDVLLRERVHPQGGIWLDNLSIPVKGGSRLGVRITAPEVQNCYASLKIEE